ncbi:MBL fold metallo-hydrolase [Streptacidiphilus jiangxiensis]|uniref:Glyoxylase, beta-lactamase superfamily II n=1 Tax=Streptacidiphilus jiangxiensis TaxID=235985 RepID=A0A1H7WBM5_STRJI|nr:MBL fold metallo-hydrolase [Streptacidiphilus jiangxiensis]SEM18982.1 Glyoxylase, beta-lactamase superfamily II [Streptacidiphilus jiangxiensis]
MSRRTQPDRVHQVAPAVERLGDGMVNFYLVDHPDGLVLVDAGLPGHLGQLREHLARSGRSLHEIKAVLLTHGHPDHTGLVTAAQQAGADIWIHEADAAILADGPRSAMRHAKPERSMFPYLLRRPASISGPLHLARMGGFSGRPVHGAHTFQGDHHFDEIPGRPQAVALPGHTDGTVAYHFPALGVLFTGDALVTREDMIGHTGPSLVSRGFTHDGAAALSSLDRLAELPPALLLPGHGPAFADGPQAAATQARHMGLH